MFEASVVFGTCVNQSRVPPILLLQPCLDKGGIGSGGLRSGHLLGMHASLLL